MQVMAQPVPGVPQYTDKAITWPIDGAVFQQDVNGKGQIPVLGFLNSFGLQQGLYTVQASLQPLNVKTGLPIPGATTINQTITGTNTIFSTTFTNVNAGWYALRVTFTPQRPYMKSYTVGPTKVGIGEVFVISGQSNAQGLPNVQNVPDAYKVAQPFVANENAYDGVRVDRARNNATVTGVASSTLGLYSLISPMAGVNSLVNVYDAGIAPNGNSLWYWAKLGEKIVNAKNVPVAFFNASLGGATITEWERSIDVNKTVSGRGKDNLWTRGQGLPYMLLRRTLNLYTSLYGIRAVLWMQGETDAITQVDSSGWGAITVTNQDQTTDTYDRTVHSTAEYAQKLQRVIAESRTTFQNRALPWVIAKATFINGASNELIRNGQEAVITSGVTNVHRGPDMDQIIGPGKRRTLADNVTGDVYGSEPTHLKGNGLTDAADAWFNAIVGPGKLLDGASPPITPSDLGTVAQSIVLSADEQTLSAPSGTVFRWLNEASGPINPNQPVSLLKDISTLNNCATCQVGADGFRRALVQNANGNFIITQAIPYPYYVVDDTQPPAQPAGLPTAACYTIKVDKTGKRLQAMGDNSVLQQNASNASNQIWKLDDRGNGRVSFTVQDGTNRAVQATNGANNGSPLALSGYAANGLYDWSLQSNPSNAGQWRVYYPANTNTWDLEGYATGPLVQIYGNTSESFSTHRSFQFEPASCPTTGSSCNFTPSVTSNVTNPTCGQTVQLTANCSGANCDQLTYNWTGTGQTSQSIPVTLPAANGSYSYAVTVSRPGCSTTTTSITFNVSGCSSGTIGGGSSGGVNLPTAACYTIKVDKTGKRLQAMGDNSVLQQNASNASNQIWKLDDRGNGRVSFTVQDGTNRAVQATNGANNGSPLALSGYAANGLYDWSLQSNPSNAGQWRVYYPANTNTWDLEGYATGPLVQIYGNTSESFSTHRSFQFEPASCPTTGSSCNFTPSVTSNVTNPTCGQTVQLTANCSGANCDQLTYNWTGTGQTSQSIPVTLPAANGSYSYAVTVSRPGCSTTTTSITFNVSGCSSGTIGSGGTGTGSGGGCNLPTNACYTINVDQTGKRLQAMGDNTVQQQNASNASNQIWKLEDRGNGQVSFAAQDGTNRLIQPVGAPTQGAGISLGSYTGSSQHWAVQCNPAATNQWRVFAPSTTNTWDMQGAASLPYLQLYGSTSEPFATYRSFRFEAATCPVPGGGSPVAGGGSSCNFSLAPGFASGNANRSCNQAVTLNANCSGADCAGVSYSWSGNGISGSGPSVSFNAPAGNGSYTYTVTAVKAGCGTQTSTVALTVSGCGATDPCAAYTVGTQVAYRSPGIGDPSVKVVVAIVGGCKRAVWSNGDGVVNRDWLPYVTANPGFSINEIASCLKFSGEPCSGRIGVDEPAEEPMSLELVVAPNPNNGQFTVRFQTQIGQPATLRLSDLNGQAVRPVQTITGTGGTHQEAISLPAHIQGVLLLEVISGQQRGSRKVLIE